MQTIRYPYEGITYEAEWDFIDDDNIVVYLPDGPRETWLRGIEPEGAAMVHLKAYAHTQLTKK